MQSGDLHNDILVHIHEAGTDQHCGKLDDTHCFRIVIRNDLSQFDIFITGWCEYH